MPKDRTDTFCKLAQLIGMATVLVAAAWFFATIWYAHDAESHGERRGEYAGALWAICVGTVGFVALMVGRTVSWWRR